MTEDQRAAVCLVLNKMVEVKNCETAQEVAAVEPLRVILAGSAGTGKTRVIRVIYSFAWAYKFQFRIDIIDIIDIIFLAMSLCPCHSFLP